MAREAEDAKAWCRRIEPIHGSRRSDMDEKSADLSRILDVLAEFSLEKPRVLACHPCGEGLEVTVEIKLPKNEFEGESDA